MSLRTQTECAYQEISSELIDIVTWLSEGELNPEEFSRTVAMLEARKLQRHGFRLSSAVGQNGIVHFSLRFADTDELCASLDVNPATGQLTTRHTCA